MHAEAMLLVDDGEAEVAELDALLKQGVRADGDVDLAGGERGRAWRAAAAAVSRPVNSASRRPAALGQRAHALEMLAGQEFPSAPSARPAVRLRRHAPSRYQRDDRLAGADVALQQPHHALGRREIGADFLDRARLRAGQVDRAGRRGVSPRCRPSPHLRSAGPDAHARAHHHQRELAREQFVIGEPLPRTRSSARRRQGFAARAAARQRLGEAEVRRAVAASPASIHSGSAARASARLARPSARCADRGLR